MMDRAYVIAMGLISVVLCVGCAWIVMDYVAGKWYDNWMKTILAFQEDEERVIKEVKLEFIKELMVIKNTVENVPVVRTRKPKIKG